MQVWARLILELFTQYETAFVTTDWFQKVLIKQTEQGSCLDPQIDEFLKRLSVAWLALRVKRFKEMPVVVEKKKPTN